MIPYDLHIHSCLSPCGENDMTVNNIAGMAKIKGLKAVAVTDHNTLKNVKSFDCACRQYGLVCIPGVEITSAEEIHMLMYFRSVADGEAFEHELDTYRTKIKNKPEFFGEQYVLDENDGITENYPYLLPVACMLSADEIYEAAKKYGAAVVPAHIDKTSNSMIGILGMMPEAPVFPTVEIKSIEKKADIFKANTVLSNSRVITNSDAHMLWDINEAENLLPIDESGSEQEIRNRIVDFLRGT